MPADQEEAVIEIASPDSSISVTPHIPSPDPSEHSISQGSDSDSGVQLDPTSIAIYGRIQIPPEQTLKDLLKKVAGSNNYTTLTQVKLQVISTDMCLQHLSFHTPQLTELNLDGSVLSSLRDLGCGLNSLKILHVSRCGLSSLDGMFGLQTLEELHASNNTIEDLSPCSCLPSIRNVDLRRNRIKDISSVSFLTLCETLEHLGLDENEELIEIPEYRQIVKGLLPNLKTLDGKDLSNDKNFNYVIQAERSLQDAIPSTSGKECFLPAITPNTKIQNVPSKRPSTMEGSFTVRFPPKVLSPRPSSGSSSDSNITFYRSELPNIHKKNKSNGCSEDGATTSSSSRCNRSNRH